MDLQLKDKQALITGGSRGIGRAVAEILAQEGCDLMLSSRDEASLLTAQKTLNKMYGVTVDIFPADLSRSNDVEALAKISGDIDILVNNAGAIPGGTLDAIDEPQWREAWDLKVFGYINLTRRLFAKMQQRQAGVIINVIGLAGERPDAGYIAGSTANAGLMAFSRALGSTAPDSGIRVLGINPGLVATDRMVSIMETRAEQQLGDATRWQELLKHLPFSRAASAEEVARLVAFMASPCASYISGTVVTIDGGASHRSFAY